MEIERKFLVDKFPVDLETYPHKRYVQGYLCRNPVVRVRDEGGEYVLTYKGAGLLAREEYNLPLNEEAFLHMIKKCDGRVITKNRYRIQIPGTGLTAELDVFLSELSPLVMVEVEFESEEEAKAFLPPDWFGKEVTYDERYHNSVLSLEGVSNE